MKRPGIIRTIRWCSRTLIMLVCVTMVAGLASTAPAQAAPAVPAAPPSAVANSVLRHAATGMKETESTASNGDVTIDVDPGVSFDTTTAQQLISRIQNENPRLSDTVKRMFEQGMVQLPAGTADASWDPATGWQDFDGTLALDSDGTGISLTIPAADVQTSATWWQEIVAAAVGVIAIVTLRALCVATLVAIGGVVGGVVGQTFCAFSANVIGNVIRYAMVKAWEGDALSPGAWAQIIAISLITSVSAGAWEAGINKFVNNKMVDWFRRFGTYVKNTFSSQAPPEISAADVSSVGTFLQDLADDLPAAIAAQSSPGSSSGEPCDIYLFNDTPCGAAYSTTRAMYSSYNGPLYQVRRASDNGTTDIGVLSAGGYADASEQNSFCAGTSCTITKIYDQSPDWNDLTIFTGQGSAAGPDHGADASALPVKMAGNHQVYGVDFSRQTGYRDDNTTGIATGDQPEGMYMVASGTNVNSDCCFDFGNAEHNDTDRGAGHMDAVNLSTKCYNEPCSGTGPWVQADLEDGLFQGGARTRATSRINQSPATSSPRC